MARKNRQTRQIKACLACFSLAPGTDADGVVPNPKLTNAAPTLRDNHSRTPDKSISTRSSVGKEITKAQHTDEGKPASNRDNYTRAQTFLFKELVAATRNFQPECFLGEGGFGRVYKGSLNSTGQIVAVKQLDQSGIQGDREFLVEVLILSLLQHPNLVNLIGYCAEDDQRLLVYEYMPLGSLEDHLFDKPPGKKALDWNTRMQIATGAAWGLEYLHDKADPPVIYRDFKPSNILLDEGFKPKLSDFGLAKFGPTGNKSHISTRVMGTYGYCAPEYAMTGKLTKRSDVYSFGVVLLELITGRRAIDQRRPREQSNLVNWARPFLKDRMKFTKLADPKLRGRYPVRALHQALEVAAMCLQEKGEARPLIRDVVAALTYVASHTSGHNRTDITAHPVRLQSQGCEVGQVKERYIHPE